MTDEVHNKILHELQKIAAELSAMHEEVRERLSFIEARLTSIEQTVTEIQAGVQAEANPERREWGQSRQLSSLVFHAAPPVAAKGRRRTAEQSLPRALRPW